MSVVTLAVPAEPDYLRLVRLACADAGSRAGLDYEEIDDLRIAVTELCNLMLGDGARGVMSIELVTRDGEVTVRGRAEQAGRASSNELSEMILAQVVDTHELRDEGGGRAFELTKRSRVQQSPASPTGG